MHTRCVFQHFRKLLTCQTLFDFQRCHLAHGNRCLLGTSHLSGDGHIFQHDSFRFETDNTQVTFAGFDSQRLIAHVR